MFAKLCLCRLPSHDFIALCRQEGWDILFQSASGYAPTHQAEDARVIPVMDNAKGLRKSLAYPAGPRPLYV